MTIREDLYAALSAVASGKVFWHGQVPEQQDAPYVVLRIINTDPQNSIDAESTNLFNFRLQVDAWGTKTSTADALATSVVSAVFAATSFKATQINDFDAEESQQRLSGRTLEFSIWNN